ncbi:MAG TPA: hypothetical protein VHD14_17040 [Pseudolabrys sp.]|nr:hypothetical protein [Pseudolabrys sp.]
MAGNRAFFAAAVLGFGVLIALSGPASAEFFGCNDQHSSRTYTRSYTPRASSHSYVTHSYASQRYASQRYASHAFSAQRRPSYAQEHYNPFYTPRTGFH